jgi:peroxiredoxin
LRGSRRFSWKSPLHVAAVGLVAVLLVLLAWRLAVEQGSRALAQAVAAGKGPAAPDFELPRLDSKGKLRLSSLRGRVVLLNFWASWCTTCKDEAPTLESAWRRWRGRGVIVLGLDAQDFRSDARSFMHQNRISYPNLHDGSGGTLDSYGVSGFPETWFVSRTGRLVAEHVNGPLSGARLDRDLRLALSR